jgi:hypothetical protein
MGLLVLFSATGLNLHHKNLEIWGLGLERNSVLGKDG